MNISEKLKENLNYVETSELLSKSELSISCLGSRLITVDGYEGSAYIADFAEKALDNPQRSYFFGFDGEPERDLDLETRLSATYCFIKINNYYTEADRQIEEKSYLTQLIALVQAFFSVFSYRDESLFYPYTTRFDTEEPYCKNFLGFNDDEFQEHFPGKKPPFAFESALHIEHGRRHPKCLTLNWIRDNLDKESITPDRSREWLLNVMGPQWFEKPIRA